MNPELNPKSSIANKSNSRKVVLITGGAGFIGWHLSKKLIDDGIEVRILDDLSSRPLMPVNQQILLRKDVADITSKDLQNVGCIYHLAASKHITESFNDPVKYSHDYYRATKLFEEAKKAGVDKVVVGSTCEVYGSKDKQPISENSRLSPKSPYAATKAGIELLANVYRESYGMQINIARLFNVFGPGERPDAVIPSFCKELLEKGTVTIEGDGLQRRDFSYISDTVSALYNLQFVDSFSKCHVINIGSGSSKSIRELANLLIEINNEGEINFVKGRIQEINEFCADCSTKNKILNCIDSLDFEEGIRQTLSWWKKYLKSSVEIGITHKETVCV